MKKIAIGAVFAAMVAAGTYVYAQSDNMAGMDHSGMNMGNDGMAMMSHATLIPPELANDPATVASAAAMDKMMADMMVPYTGDPDIDFARGMIPHHQAAIDMAKIQLEFGTDPGMRELAEAIIAAQESEIATLKAFLATKGM
ncbi:MAG: hypothetical protein A2092_16660 [Rhodobacteraceae bacterium GWE1_64_9]|jgi:uncharacterized protein (DUF305 family)|nr:MAG: hypothetical protein A2092_16660 [Rhodobacteraceae bacterium GWE1_64_9]OHC47491.1 MAG: hypothetical protein A2X69_04770 [Rhodobacteraceae bacterium GWF1_65_7]HOZ34329.1 DUF305 domain-containing protein [Tabrizicola sp.]